MKIKKMERDEENERRAYRCGDEKRERESERSKVEKPSRPAEPESDSQRSVRKGKHKNRSRETKLYKAVQSRKPGFRGDPAKR